jgi:hypothetical protein
MPKTEIQTEVQNKATNFAIMKPVSVSLTREFTK